MPSRNLDTSVNGSIDEDGGEAAVRDAIERRAERSRLRKAADALGWKLIGSSTAEVRCERTLTIGPRTVVVRGRVPIPLPEPMTAEAGDRAVAELVDPTIEQLRVGMERVAAKILTEPDDEVRTHVFERSSFFSAVEEARRGFVNALQQLENRRVDEKVDAQVGLRFYLDGFTTKQRTFEYFVGPTNSGKTHAALEVLRAADRGIYLAPLRLLALEVHERLNELGAPTSLVTGEERVILPDARYVSSTVEMVDLNSELDVAIVDEAQMLEDTQRGWAWTLAIAGVRAKHVVMCGSREGLLAAQRLAARLGVTMTVREFERKNPLRVVPAIPLSALQRGDAVVGFSRKAVVELQSAVVRLGFSSAAIYGSLSPAVRRREAERFRTGEADVLVATDAIGLGLNLPIRRLIFTAIEKFDGVGDRLLTPQEVRQIAGRAGRYGIHEEGLVSATEPRHVALLRRSLEARDVAPKPGPIWISPTDEHLRRLSTIIGTTRISRLLQFFQTRVMQQSDDVRIADVSDTIDVAIALEFSDGFLALPFAARCTYSRAPVSTRGNALTILAQWGTQHATNGRVPGTELLTGVVARDALLLYEDRSRLATLYLWLSQRFPDVYTNRDEVALLREQIDADILAALRERGEHGARARRPAKPAFHRKPVRYGPRPPSYGSGRRRR
jgi:ATP-dependent RNA helicase SUPV3L1/SUV3